MLSQFPFLMVSCYRVIRFCNFLSLVLILAVLFLFWFSVVYLCFRILPCPPQAPVTPACGLYFSHFFILAPFMCATLSGIKGGKGEGKDKCFHPSLPFFPCKAWLGGRAHCLASGLITDECRVQWALPGFSYELSQLALRSVPQWEGCCKLYSCDITPFPSLTPHTSSLNSAPLSHSLCTSSRIYLMSVLH